MDEKTYASSIIDCQSHVSGKLVRSLGAAGDPADGADGNCWILLVCDVYAAVNGSECTTPALLNKMGRS